MQCAPGYAWAAKRQLLETHRLYDACILGGGDSALVRAAYGRFDEAIRFQQMNHERKDHYLRWAGDFYNSVRGDLTFVRGRAAHLWHGDAQHRRYHARLNGLERFAFDPFTDVTVGRNGVWV